MNNLSNMSWEELEKFFELVEVLDSSFLGALEDNENVMFIHSNYCGKYTNKIWYELENDKKEFISFYA